MNENIDLTKILKDCPQGWKLYSPMLGEVDFLKIRNDLYAIVTIQDFHTTSFTKEGFYYADVDGECLLFPSKDQRDWSKFTAPCYKKESDTISCLEELGKKEYGLKSFKDEDVHKFMQYIEKQAKSYEFNLPNRSYDIYAFAKDLLVWLEKKGKQSSIQTNERAWLYLVSDVLTWKDGIGQYLDDPGVQELAKRLCSEYAQKLYSPSNTGNSTDKIEPRFKVGDWVVNNFGDSWHIDSLDEKNYQVYDGKGNYNYFPISKQDEMHIWTIIQDAKDGDVLVHSSFMFDDFIFIYNNTSILQSYCYYSSERNRFIIEDRGHHCPWNMQEVTPATKEQRGTLEKAMADAGYTFDFENKELKKIEQPKLTEFEYAIKRYDG